MDREIDPRIVRERRLRRAGFVASLSLLAVAVLWTLVAWVRPSLAREQLRTGEVTRGAVEEVITGSGVVVPAFEKVISSPIDARIVRIHLQPGAQVHKGDEIVSLDLEPAKLAVAQLEQQIAQTRGDELQKRSQLDESLRALESEIEQKKLDLEILRYKAEQTQKLRLEGLVADETSKQATVAAKKAEIELAQLERQLGSKRQQAGTEMQVLSLGRSMLEQSRHEAGRQLDLATARSDGDGVLTWVTPTEGVTVRRGDVLAKIADLRTIRVEGSVSDVHARSIRVGQRVHIKSESASYDGRVSTVSPAVVDGVLKFTVDITRAPAGALHNQQRVDVLVVTSRKEDVLRVPKGAFEAGGRVPLFVVEGDRAMRRDVTLGISGSDQYEVIEGLSKGERVVLSDMNQFADIKQVRIK